MFNSQQYRFSIGNSIIPTEHEISTKILCEAIADSLVLNYSKLTVYTGSNDDRN